MEKKIAMIALYQATMNEHFKKSLAKHPPESMFKIRERDRKYIKAEKSMKKPIFHDSYDVSNKKRNGTYRQVSWSPKDPKPCYGKIWP